MTTAETSNNDDEKAKRERVLLRLAYGILVLVILAGAVLIPLAAAGAFRSMPKVEPERASVPGTWTSLDAGTVPDRAASPVYDPQVRGIVTFGGVTVSSTNTKNLDETLVFKDDKWQQISTPTVPPARVTAHLVYDPAAGGILMWGGLSAHPYVGTEHQTWLFNGSNWELLHPADTPPFTSRGVELGYTSEGGEAVLLNLPTEATWAFVTGNWEPLVTNRPHVASFPAEESINIGTSVFGVGYRTMWQFGSGTKWWRFTVSTAPITNTGYSWAGASGPDGTVAVGENDPVHRAKTYYFNIGTQTWVTVQTQEASPALTNLVYDPSTKEFVGTAPVGTGGRTWVLKLHFPK